MGQTKPSNVHPLLGHQLTKCTVADGDLDARKLQQLVNEAYQSGDQTRRRLERAMEVMNDELASASAEREELLSALKMRNAQFENTLSNMRQGLAMFSDQNALQVINHYLLDALGYENEDDVRGLSLRDIILDAPTLTPLSPIILHQIDKMKPDNAPKMGALNEKFIIERHDERSLQCRLTLNNNRQLILTADDITEQRAADLRLAHMANHDALTGLPNRHYLADMLNMLGKDGRRGKNYAIMCLDLDQFKSVNDTLGHAVGDRLLQLVTQRLQDIVRSTDTIIRLGGDEFAIVYRRFKSHAAITSFAERLIAEISQPYSVNDQNIVIGVSIGVATLEQGENTPDQLLKRADIALYQAKADGRGTMCFFEPGMDVVIQERRQMEIDMRHALVADEFELHYQPSVDTKSLKICGFEALLRWNHPAKGQLLPAQFISVAEDSNLIDAIGLWVLKKACKEAMKWKDDTLSIAVNISATQFRNTHLIDQINTSLSDSGLAAERLELEITETTLLEDNITTMDQLNRLQALGVKISMDDFGTGYSSISYLRSFPFDKVKIDQMFIREGLVNDNNLTIVRAMTNLCHELDIKTTIEGVETKEQLALLDNMSCDTAQGYLFSRPISAQGIPGLLLQENSAKPGAAKKTIKNAAGIKSAKNAKNDKSAKNDKATKGGKTTRTVKHTPNTRRGKAA